MKTLKEDILTELSLSLQKGNFLSLYLTGMENPIVVAVDEIFHTYITFKPYTLQGDFIEQPRIRQEEILKLIRLKVRYNDPFYARLRTIKKTIRKIKLEMGRATQELSLKSFKDLT